MSDHLINCSFNLKIETILGSLDFYKTTDKMVVQSRNVFEKNKYSNYGQFGEIQNEKETF